MQKEDFPIKDLGQGSTLKVIAGDFDGIKGPAKTHSPINIYEVRTVKESLLELNLPDQSNTLIVQLKNFSTYGNSRVSQGEVAILDREGSKAPLSLSSDSRLLILNGAPIDEPIAHYGPFVMNTRKEIMQAIQDFEQGKMGQIVREEA